MKFNFYVEKLFSSSEFEEFRKENSDAYMCGGFFVIDLENLKNPDNKNHIDYFVPSLNKLYSFQLEEGVKKVPIEDFGGKVPSKVSDNYSFDFGDIEKMIRDKMEEEEVKSKIQKILISLQNKQTTESPTSPKQSEDSSTKEGKDYLVCTVFISGMGIINLHIDLFDNKVVFFEKKSFMDMIKIVKKGEAN